MTKFVKINLITVGATILVYSVFLLPRDTAFAKAIKSIPFFQETKQKVFNEVGKEILKFVGTYFLLQTLRIR